MWSTRPGACAVTQPAPVRAKGRSADRQAGGSVGGDRDAAAGDAGTGASAAGEHLETVAGAYARCACDAEMVR